MTGYLYGLCMGLWFLTAVAADNVPKAPKAGVAEFVREYRFANDASVSHWENSGDPYGCKLMQTVQGYGRVAFTTKPGTATFFTLQSWQGLAHDTPGYLQAIAPVWRHDLASKTLDTVQLKTGQPHMLSLNARQTQNVLSAFSSGFTLRLTYKRESLGKEFIVVETLPVAWQQAFAQYNACLAKLLPYDFETVRHSNVYFDEGSEALSLTARQQLSRIVHYVEAGAKITKIVVKGYADSEADYNHNRRLAGRRAQAVKAYFVNNGIKPETVQIEDVFSRYLLIGKNREGSRAHIQLFN